MESDFPCAPLSARLRHGHGGQRPLPPRAGRDRRVPFPFVGRERELALLDALATGAGDGRGAAVVIAGDAGIGKTRLVTQVLVACERRGFACYRSQADELERNRPFGVIRDALRVDADAGGRRAEIARLLDGHDERFGLQARITTMLTDLTGEIGRDGPAVIVIDDLQWADESSLIAVNAIARLCPSRPLLLICALRRYPAGPLLHALLAALTHRGAQRIELDGLTGADVAALAASRVGAKATPGLLGALASAAGNPFYVDALLACAAADPHGDAATLSAPELPASLRHAVLEQLRFLPEPTAQVLRGASVVGRCFSVADVALISPSSVADVAAALSAAEQAGIVVTEGERLCFRHDLIREAIYDQMAPDVRRSLHRDLAARLVDDGAGVQRVAAQLMLGAAPGDGQAIEWLRQAASAALHPSPKIAADLITRALELSDASWSGRGELLSDAVLAFLWGGRPADAERVCLEVLTDPQTAADAPLARLALADARLQQGRFRETLEACRAGLECATLEDFDRLHLEALEAFSSIYLGDAQGVELARRIVAQAPPCSPRTLAQEAIAQWELFRGRPDRALPAFELAETMRAQAVPGSRTMHRSGSRAGMWHALALLDLDRLDEARRMLEQETALTTVVPALPRTFLAACNYHAGRFEQTLRECDAAAAAAAATGSFMPATAPALAAVVALRAGELGRATELLGEAEGTRTAAEAIGDTIVRWARALQLEATGQARPAADAAAGALDSYLRAGFASYIAWHAPDFVRIALADGRAEEAERATLTAEQAAATVPVASRRAGALRARGLLHGDPAALLAAIDACREAPRPLDLAHALRDAAARLAAEGERERARALADEALKLLSDLGAGGDERQARQRLRDAGLTISMRAKHRSGGQGWQSLTDAELQVVQLAAQGRSNPEIAQSLYLSRRTVGWHLSNVFRKLGIGSRAELAATVARREQAGG